MSEEIRPALTPEEWARRKAVRNGCSATAPASTGALYVRNALQSPAETVLAPDLNPVLVALANAALPDGDPRKVTREDVHACADASMFDGPHPALARLALKLAALLPPEP